MSDAAESIPNEVIAEGLAFPEGPAFDRDGNLYVVELAGGQISRIARDGTRSVFAEPGGGPNGSNFGPEGDLWVCNCGGFPGPDRERGRLERISPKGEVTVVVEEIDGEPLASPNDLGFDPEGNLYFTDPVWGDMSPEGTPPGSVCYRSSQGETRRLHTGLAFPNGIAVSPNAGTLVVCETLTHLLHAFPIHEPGVLGAPRPFANLGAGAGPDGFAFDCEGHILCAGAGSGALQVFGPGGGERIDRIPVEDPMVTNVCFGGPDFRSLYITESGKGRVVRVEWKRPGMVLFPDR